MNEYPDKPTNEPLSDTANPQMSDNEKLVLLVSYQRYEDARRVVMLLESCDLPCYIRNELTNNILGSFVDVGGYRVEVPEHVASEALELLQSSGLKLPSEEDSTVGEVSRLAERLPILRNRPLETRLWAMLGLTVLALLVLVLIIYIFSN